MELREMKRCGQVVTPEQQAEMLKLWFDLDVCPFLKAWLLEVQVKKVLSKVGVNLEGQQALRIGDALIQKMRKSGVIEFDSGRWHLTDDYADNIQSDIDSWIKMKENV